MKKKIALYSALFGTIIFLDFFSKQWILMYCPQPYHLTSWLSWSMTINRGISWSLFHSEHESIFYILTLLIALIIVALGIYTYQRWHNHKLIVGEVLVLAGALSNFVDRLIHHGVIDFIAFHYKEFYWPLFNVADIAIVIGALIMLMQDFFSPK